MAGALFFFVCCALHAAPPDSLVRELLRDEQWRSARIESLRGLLRDPDDLFFRYAQAVAAARMGLADGDWAAELQEVAGNDMAGMPLRTAAALIAGRLRWQQGDTAEAARLFRFAYEKAPDHAMFLEASCSLGMLFNADRSLLEQHADLIVALHASRDMWSQALREACSLHKAPAAGGIGGLFAWPGRAVVGFYRLAVSPALSQRCSLHPSCSEYFRQASIKYGFLGLAMQADRFFREPSVVAVGEKPIVIDDQIFYEDPLCDHDFWFRRNRRPED